MTETLTQIYERHKYPDGSGDKGTAHTYIDVYQELLEPYRYDSSASLLEIGIALGYSIRMWGEYFSGKVFGVDIQIEHQAQDLLHNSRFQIFQCDATSPDFLHLLGDTKFDVIIDDGSHRLNHQVASFELLFPRVNAGGVYVIEDIVDIDNVRPVFEALHHSCQIVDNRHIKGRYDDVLAIYRF